MPKRRQLLALAAPFALFAAKPGGLPNVTLNAKDVKIQKNPFGELRIYFDGPTDQLRSMTAGSLLLNAGATPHPPHSHPEEEFMVITEGSGELFCDGKTVNVTGGMQTIRVSPNSALPLLPEAGKTPAMPRKQAPSAKTAHGGARKGSGGVAWRRASVGRIVGREEGGRLSLS